MKHITLNERNEINAMWRLVMNGKFQTCISDIDLIGNSIVNKIIEQALEIYLKEFSPNGEWDVRNIYIEESIHKDFISKVLEFTDEKLYSTKDKKIQYIKDIVFPFKIKNETVEKYLSLPWGTKNT